MLSLLKESKCLAKPQNGYFALNVTNRCQSKSQLLKGGDFNFSVKSTHKSLGML